jgi:replicative DNA helicase
MNKNAYPEMDERIPPQAIDIEKSLLGSIIIDVQCACDAFTELTEDDFYSINNMTIFKNLKEMFEKNIPFREDVLSIANYLKSKGELNTCGGEPYLGELISNIATSSSVTHYISVLKQKSLSRGLISASTEISNIAHRAENSEELLKKSEDIFFKAVTNNVKESVVSFKELIPGIVQKCLDKKPGEFTGIPTGFSKLDKLICGIENQQLVYLGGRTSNGKTALAQIIMMNMAIMGYRCAYFTFESNKFDFGRRCLGMASQINFFKLRRGYMDSNDRAIFAQNGPVLADLPIFIDESYDLTVQDLRSKITSLKIKHGIDIAFIDYIQLINRGNIEKNKSTNDQVSYVSRSLKNIAKHVNIPIIALSQLSRIDEKSRKKDFTPRLKDLRDSGSLEQDGDVVMLIHRESLYNPDEGNVNQGELIVAKQREGDIGSIMLGFEKQCARYYELGEEEKPKEGKW